MTKGPRRIHHVLPETIPDDGLMETLCNRAVKVSRSGDFLSGFTTVPVGNVIQCVFDARDVTCNTCQHVWRNIR